MAEAAVVREQRGAEVVLQRAEEVARLRLLPPGLTEVRGIRAPGTARSATARSTLPRRGPAEAHHPLQHLAALRGGADAAAGALLLLGGAAEVLLQRRGELRRHGEVVHPEEERDHDGGDDGGEGGEVLHLPDGEHEERRDDGKVLDAEGGVDRDDAVRRDLIRKDARAELLLRPQHGPEDLHHHEHERGAEGQQLHAQVERGEHPNHGVGHEELRVRQDQVPDGVVHRLREVVQREEGAHGEPHRPRRAHGDVDVPEDGRGGVLHLEGEVHVREDHPRREQVREHDARLLRHVEVEARREVHRRRLDRPRHVRTRGQRDEQRDERGAHQEHVRENRLGVGRSAEALAVAALGGDKLERLEAVAVAHAQVDVDGVGRVDGRLLLLVVHRGVVANLVQPRADGALHRAEVGVVADRARDVHEDGARAAVRAAVREDAHQPERDVDEPLARDNDPLRQRVIAERRRRVVAVGIRVPQDAPAAGGAHRDAHRGEGDEIQHGVLEHLVQGTHVRGRHLVRKRRRRVVARVVPDRLEAECRGGAHRRGRPLTRRGVLGLGRVDDARAAGEAGLQPALDVLHGRVGGRGQTEPCGRSDRVVYRRRRGGQQEVHVGHGDAARDAPGLAEARARR
mmetsp:Transcript_41358/g.127837  ORF Transcript_41358/g.127837 Transcript_41358/m.127837 type:complete len:627 (-) Transcript_41358:1359-3239(-)